LSASLAAIALLAVCNAALGQNYIEDFHNRNAEMKAAQPSWMTPLVMTTPLLGQFVREEFVRQCVAGGDSVWNIGNGKGPNMVLSSRVEEDLVIPNYVVHGAAAGTDGMGDFGVTTRIRIASGNAKHGNYAVSLIASQTWTTGLTRTARRRGRAGLRWRAARRSAGLRR